MAKERVDRLNSLLREVISEVLRNDLPNRDIPDLLTVTSVEITKDLRYAKVHISLIGNESEKYQLIPKLQKMSGYIATLASKKVVMRYFPELTFILDESVDQHMRIETLLKEIKEKEQTPNNDA